MSYPTATQMQGTKAVPLPHTEVSRAVSGRPRFRSYHSRTWHELVILHELTAAEKDALDAHYEANKQTAFTVTLQDTNTLWTVQYRQKPEYEWIAGSRWKTEVQLVEVS